MRKDLLAVVACAMLLLAGCGGGSDNAQSAGSSFLGGTSGLLVSFEENSPPAEVLDKGNFPFDIIVKLKNSGEWDIPKEKVRVKISGILPSQFSLLDSDLLKNAPEDMPKMQKDSTGTLIDSQPVFVEFTNFDHKGAITGQQLNYPLRADVCYNYGTLAVSQLCVAENILAQKNTEICKVNEAKEVFNSGAPVQVSSLTESARSSSKIGFTFTVEHKGTGDIYEKDTMCNKESRVFEDRVYVKVDAGVEGVACSGLDQQTEGFVKLVGGSKVVSCTLDVANPSDYKLPIAITLGYDYEVGQSTQIVVKSSGE